jgi:hypothetical protein
MGGTPKTADGRPIFTVDVVEPGGVGFTYGFGRGEHKRTKNCTAEEAIDAAVEIIRVAALSLARERRT